MPSVGVMELAMMAVIIGLLVSAIACAGFLVHLAVRSANRRDNRRNSN